MRDHSDQGMDTLVLPAKLKWPLRRSPQPEGARLDTKLLCRDPLRRIIGSPSGTMQNLVLLLRLERDVPAAPDKRVVRPGVPRPRIIKTGLQRARPLNDSAARHNLDERAIRRATAFQDTQRGKITPTNTS